MRRAGKKDILNGNIAEQMLMLLFPLFLGYLLQQLYSFADNIVLGRLISKEALAAVGGSANSLINIVLNFVGGITSAITVLVAQSYGSGNITVKSTKTSAVGHTFSKGETYAWTVTASAGDVITIYSTDSSYSPDMTLIQVYAGSASLNATATGDNTDFVITDIEAGSTGITLSNLVDGGTYSYYLVANYVDGTTATSNTQEVTLTSLNVNPNTAITSIAADGDEIESVTYVNMSGVQSKDPFEGVNIKVVRYKSGAVKSSKVLY